MVPANPVARSSGAFGSGCWVSGDLQRLNHNNIEAVGGPFVGPLFALEHSGGAPILDGRSYRVGRTLATVRSSLLTNERAVSKDGPSC